MNKLFQNQASDSKLTQPAVVIYGFVVWLFMGLLTHMWWPQFLCFVGTTYLMVELNNHNALIRIYSRMVSSSFVVLSCCACFLFPSLRGAVMQLCVVAAWLLLFNSYQDRTATGWVYYAFLFLGVASMAYVHTLCFLPFLWLLMATNLQSLSWRTFSASLLGLATPYWFASCWLLWREDFTPLAQHFEPLAHLQLPPSYSTLPVGHVAFYAFLIVVATTGAIHYIRTHYQDKIRIRQLYGFFIWMTVISAALLAFQPQHADALLRLMIINASPLIAHFISLTRTRVTNAAFIALLAASLLITAYNLWTSSSLC